MLSTILKKHHRAVFSAAAQSTQVSTRFFSAAAATPQEHAKKSEEWGEKYSDECFAFEKEWKIIADKIEKE